MYHCERSERRKGEHTSRPHPIGVGMTGFPTNKVSLHVVIPVSNSRLEYPTVITDIVPAVQIIDESRSGSSDNNTTISARNEVIIMPVVPAKCICFSQLRRQSTRRRDDAATCSTDRNYFLLVLRSQRGGVCVCCQNHLFS